MRRPRFVIGTTSARHGHLGRVIKSFLALILAREESSWRYIARFQAVLSSWGGNCDGRVLVVTLPEVAALQKKFW